MTFVRELCARLGAHPWWTVLVEGSGPARRSVTAGALLARAAAFRRGLHQRGVGAGDRLVLIAANSADWVACDLACFAEGVVLVPLDPRMTPAELGERARDAEPSLIVIGEGSPHPATHPTGARREAPRTSLEALGGDGPAPFEPPADVPPDALATILYTSGSSGQPKGVMLSRLNLGFMLGRTEHRLERLTGLPPGSDRALHYLPLCYAGSRILMLSCLLRGARVQLVADPRQIPELLSEAAPDYFLNVPLLLERFERAATSAIEARGPVPTRLLVEAKAAWVRTEDGRAGRRDRALLALADRLLFVPLRARFGPRLKALICGSAPLGEETQRFFRMAGLPVFQAYGLTETTALCTLDVEGQVRTGWVGPALPDVELRRSEEGEVLTRGPHVFCGYWGRPEETAEAFAGDGWLRTGDLGQVDGSGRWRIEGRRSALIVLQTGHKVPPEPLEEALRRALAEVSAALADAQVIALGHGRSFVSALLTPPEHGTLSEEQVERALAALDPTLAPYRRVRRFAVLPERFSVHNGLLTSNLKLRRREIATRYAALIDELYAREAAPVAALA